ncbi:MULTISPECIES: chemotaxis protein CheX [Sporosarcina]|uniref:chemotaxis protein CheX n=1 Tax=Sporosarcina TaxID=1569 RepID=UPI00129B9376|nr:MULTISPECIES: chemotaxis protein CheX [Sporosarcina]GKV67246.1 CheY-P phosphatase CheX [Sporosarcina sp. NCCP-2331]GLB57602.1 CheY-P phosphatase CheX [Sporosarcina sp. NCCP-2378]
MSTATNVQKVLNATISSLTTVIPIKFQVLSPALIQQPYEQREISVLIGLIGNMKGRLIVEPTNEIIDKIGQAMFGMHIEGEMAESFTGELGNMIAGNLCTILEKEGMILDISPPTVLTGKTKFYGFKQAFKIPVQFEDGELLNLLLTIDEEN